MSKKVLNSIAQRTYLQINSDLEMLYAKHLVISYNKVPPPDVYQKECQITWFNHVSSRANAGASFTKLEQYLHILNTNSYHCLLFDGSIIRANYQFEEDLLMIQNLLWWPSPYDYGSILEDGFSPVEVVEDFFCDGNWHEVIKMRSPIRIDFDATRKAEPNHPYSHMHIESKDTRLDANRPICFSKFLDFIFKNFYPECRLDFSSQDFIEYRTPELESVEYSVSQILI